MPNVRITQMSTNGIQALDLVGHRRVERALYDLFAVRHFTATAGAELVVTRPLSGGDAG